MRPPDIATQKVKAWVWPLRSRGGREACAPLLVSRGADSSLHE